MKKVLDFSDVTEARKAIRLEFPGIVSNLSAFPAEIGSWIKKGLFNSVRYDDCVIYIKEGECTNNLFFIAPDFKTASIRIKEAIAEDSIDKTPVVAEIVDRSETESLEFPVMMTLNRMTRTGDTNFRPEKTDGIRDIRENESSIVRELLKSNFNPVCESIPDEEEIKSLAFGETAKAFIHDDEIKGLMLCSKDKSTIHLRYWWVSPDCRNSGVGSKLLNEFFRLGEGTLRQILWVDIDNINAINKYEHFGFKKESIFDHIHIIKI